MRTIDPAILLAAMATLETPSPSPGTAASPRRPLPRDCKRREPVTFYRA